MLVNESTYETDKLKLIGHLRNLRMVVLLIGQPRFAALICFQLRSIRRLFVITIQWITPRCQTIARRRRAVTKCSADLCASELDR